LEAQWITFETVMNEMERYSCEEFYVQYEIVIIDFVRILKKSAKYIVVVVEDGVITVAVGLHRLFVDLLLFCSSTSR